MVDNPQDPPEKPEAASDKPPGPAAAEPLKGEVSREGQPKPAAPPAAKADGKPAAAPPAPKVAAPPAGPTDPPPPADTPVPAFLTTLQQAVPGAITQLSLWVGDWTAIVPVTHLLDVARHLRSADDAWFDTCSDVTATDWPPRAERFDVIYCLYSTRHKHRVRLKVRVGDGVPVPSVTNVWRAAGWLEREVFDLFGIRFEGHPDLRRILMPDDWQGYPQRKDYPLEGPGELLLESPTDWLKVKQARDIE